MVQGPGVQKTFRLSSRTPEQFNVMPRTNFNFINILKKIIIPDIEKKKQILAFRLINFTLVFNVIENLIYPSLFWLNCQLFFNTLFLL